MRIRPTASLARTALATTWVALATLSLDACGPDDSAAVATRSAAQTAPSSRDGTTTPTAGIDLPAASRAGTAASAAATDVTDIASDPVQNVQASLAADSQQVTPVMSYAPGDDTQQEANNDSGGAATSNH